MSQAFDASKSLTALEQDSTIIAVIEMSQAKWLVAGVVPGVERQPLKKLAADEAALLKLLHRWRNEAGHAQILYFGRQIKRIVVAFEAAWEKLPIADRRAAGDRLLDRALGRPTQAIENPEEGEVQRTLIVRWMPPDPNDRSNVIEPEP